MKSYTEILHFQISTDTCHAGLQGIKIYGVWYRKGSAIRLAKIPYGLFQDGLLKHTLFCKGSLFAYPFCCWWKPAGPSSPSSEEFEHPFWWECKIELPSSPSDEDASFIWHGFLLSYCAIWACTCAPALELLLEDWECIRTLNQFTSALRILYLIDGDYQESIEIVCQHNI